MKTQSTIRAWQRNDLEACAAISESNEADWQLADYKSSFKVGHTGFVALQGQKVVGCIVASCLFEVADLLYIQVNPAMLGLGVAQALFNTLQLHCRAHGVERILLEVRPSNIRAISFYQKLHFTQIDRRKDYYAATPNAQKEDALILQLCM